MSTPKGRLMRAHEARTGDTVMPPSTSSPRTIQRATNRDGAIKLQYTDGSEAHMPAQTPIRIYRTVREINQDSDAPAVVFQSAGA